MRGQVDPQPPLFTVVSPSSRVPQDHPARAIKQLADDVLHELTPVLDGLYATQGRPSIPPECLLKAQLLIALYSVRSERQFCERLDYDLLFRFFLDLDLDTASWDATTFTKNRDRLMQHDVARLFFEGVLRRAQQLGLLSREHFTVDGTLIEAWASQKSFRPRGERPGDRPPPDDPGNPTVNFRGEKRSNATHQSTTDPESRLAKKSTGKEAKLSYSAHVLMENRHGLCVDFCVAPADGFAEREAGVAMLAALPARGFRPRTLGGDKGYDKGDFPDRVVALGVAPHLAINASGNLDSAARRFTDEPGYAVSQRKRKRVEEIFGWMKTVGGFRRTRFQGRAKTEWLGWWVAAAYNLLRISRLLTPLPA